MSVRVYIWHWAWWCPAHSRSCWPPPPCRSAPPCGGPWWGWGRWRSSWCRPLSPSARDDVDQRDGAEPWTYILHRVVSLVIEQPDQGGPGVTPRHHTLEGHPPALHQLRGGGGNLHEIGQNFNTERQLGWICCKSVRSDQSRPDEETSHLWPAWWALSQQGTSGCCWRPRRTVWRSGQTRRHRAASTRSLSSPHS